MLDDLQLVVATPNMCEVVVLCNSVVFIGTLAAETICTHILVRIYQLCWNGSLKRHNINKRCAMKKESPATEADILSDCI